MAENKTESKKKSSKPVNPYNERAYLERIIKEDEDEGNKIWARAQLAELEKKMKRDEISKRMNEMVDFIFPRSDPREAEVRIGHNGTMYVYRRGVSVKVPRKVLEIYQNSLAQEEIAYQAQIAAQNAVKKSLADL